MVKFIIVWILKFIKHGYHINDLSSVFQLGSNRKSEMITALNSSGITVPTDASWNEIPVYISSYKGIKVSTLTELYPTDTLGLTGGFTGGLGLGNDTTSLTSATVTSKNLIDFTNIKTLKMIHYMNKWSSSGSNPANVYVGLTNSSGAWVKKVSRSLTTRNNLVTHTEIIDVSSLTGSYYITWSYQLYFQTSASLNQVYIQS